MSSGAGAILMQTFKSRILQNHYVAPPTSSSAGDVRSPRWKFQVGLAGLRSGEWISSVSAILLFVLMFFHWFGVKLVNTSNLLFAVQSFGQGKSAWEALEYIPIVLTITIVVTLAVPALRLVDAFPKPSLPLNWLVAILGLVSMLLISVRIIDPPTFWVEPTITSEGTVQAPIFLALLAAAGIAVGGWRTMREEADGDSGV